MSLQEEDKRELLRLIECGEPLPERWRAVLCGAVPPPGYGNEAIGLFQTQVSSGRMLNCNLRAARILGYAAVEECRRLHDAPRSYADPRERERLLELLRNTGEVQCYPVTLLRPDGTSVRVRLWSRLDPEAGVVDGAVDLQLGTFDLQPGADE